jgi:hypothetical protein
VGAVFVGVPEAPQDRLVATVSLGGASLNEQKHTGTWIRRLRYRVEFAYRVGGDEESAERGVAVALDDFLNRVLANLTLGIPGASAAEIDLSQADAPEYRTVAGLEVRVYPVVVGVAQLAQFNTSP